MATVLIQILILIILLFCLFQAIVSLSMRLFDRKVKREIKALFQYQGEIPWRAISKDDLKKQPPSVQKWMISAGVVGKERINTAWISQEGTMKTEEGKAWMPFMAEYYYTLDKPGFVWYTRVQAAPLVFLIGRDKLFKGQGSMLIKLFSLITVANSKGPEINQGALLRFLAEIMWFPTAALNEYISWEQLDDNSAQATIKVGDVTASGTFTFNEDGMPVEFKAQRYMSKNKGYSLETWKAAARDFNVSNGIMTPTYVEVTWELPEGDYTWFKANNLHVFFNLDAKW